MNKIFLILILFLSSINIYGNEFILSSFPEAQQLSKKTQQPILAIFGSDNCMFCKTLISDIRSNKLSPEIDNYIICYVDVSKDKKYKSEYNINMVPDSRIILNNKQMSKNLGYTKEEYKNWIKNAKK